MTPAITPRFVVAAAIGAVVAIGAGITIAMERITAEPVARAVPAPVPVVHIPEFVGNHAFTRGEIVDGLGESAFLTDLDDGDAIARTALMVSAFYWDRGYANVHVGPPRVDRARDALVIPVDEGATFTISSVAVTGDLLGDAASHLAMIQVHPGVLFSRTMIANDRETLSTFYGDRSYAYATVLPNTKLDLVHDTIALTFDIERGPAATFEHIDVIASTADGEAAMRGVLAIAPGQPYSETGLLETKRRIMALGRRVAVSTKHGSTASLVVATFEELE